VASTAFWRKTCFSPSSSTRTAFSPRIGTQPISLLINASLVDELSDLHPAHPILLYLVFLRVLPEPSTPLKIKKRRFFMSKNDPKDQETVILS
jgi:hypothetical protein